MTLNELKSRLSIGHWYLVGIVIIAIAAVAWWLFLPSKTVTGTYATATVSGAVKGLPTTAVQLPKGIQAYQHKAIETLGLTDFIKNEMVLSAVEIKSDPHPTTSVCLVDPDTGKVRAVNKIEPYKWLAAENRREVGIYTGFRGSDRATWITGTWSLLSIKGFNAGVNGSVFFDGQHVIGVGAKYEF